MKAISKTNQRGFTLIEALVATALFVATMVSSLTIYISVLNIHKRTDATRKASENARYITEYLSKEIRNGKIDYTGPAVSPCSTTITSSSKTLEILNRDNVAICFYLGDANGTLSNTGPNLWMQKGTVGPYKINSTDVKVNKVLFYVSPTTDPYIAGSRVEPRVTITGEIQVVGSQTIVPIQTSISIPAYDIVAP